MTKTLDYLYSKSVSSRSLGALANQILKRLGGDVPSSRKRGNGALALTVSEILRGPDAPLVRLYVRKFSRKLSYSMAEDSFRKTLSLEGDDVDIDAYVSVRKTDDLAYIEITFTLRPKAGFKSIIDYCIKDDKGIRYENNDWPLFSMDTMNKFHREWERHCYMSLSYRNSPVELRRRASPKESTLTRTLEIMSGLGGCGITSLLSYIDNDWSRLTNSSTPLTGIEITEARYHAQQDEPASLIALNNPLSAVSGAAGLPSLHKALNELISRFANMSNIVTLCFRIPHAYIDNAGTGATFPGGINLGAVTYICTISTHSSGRLMAAHRLVPALSNENTVIGKLQSKGFFTDPNDPRSDVGTEDEDGNYIRIPFWHPHVETESGSVCTGGFGPLMDQAIETHRLVDLPVLMGSLLRNVNTGSMYTGIHNILHGAQSMPGMVAYVAGLAGTIDLSKVLSLCKRDPDTITELLYTMEHGVAEVNVNYKIILERLRNSGYNTLLVHLAKAKGTPTEHVYPVQDLTDLYHPTVITVTN
jgi:hypothetical protein